MEKDKQDISLSSPIYPSDVSIQATNEIFTITIFVDKEGYRFVFSPEWIKRINLGLGEFVKKYEEKARELNVSCPSISTTSESEALGYLGNISTTASVPPPIAPQNIGEMDVS